MIVRPSEFYTYNLLSLQIIVLIKLDWRIYESKQWIQTENDTFDDLLSYGE